jgi:hypothetical protein
MAMLNMEQNVHGQVEKLMNRLALAGLAVTALVVALVALLGAG